MSKYQVRDTTPDDDYGLPEIPLRGTKEECDQWADRHNAKVVASGGDPCFAVEAIQHYVVWGHINYVGKVSVEAGSEEEAKLKFELDTAVGDVNIKGGEGFVAQSAEVIQ